MQDYNYIFLIPAIVTVLLHMFFRKVDKDNKLPGVKIWYLVCMTLVGAVISFVSQSIMECLFIEISMGVVGYMAFSDYNTECLYSLPSYLIFAVGVAILVFEGKFITNILSMVICLIFVIIITLIHVISEGDLELITALIPYMAIINQNVMFVFYMFINITFFCGIIMNFKKFLCDKKKRFPMAPSILMGYIGVIIMFGVMG